MMQCENGSWLNRDDEDKLITQYFQLLKVVNSMKNSIENIIVNRTAGDRECFKKEIQMFYSRIIEESGIKIEYDNTAFKIHIPGIFSDKRYKKEKYETDVLGICIDDYVHSHMELTDVLPFCEAVIIMVFCYPETVSHSNVKDNDNHEMKAVIDAFVPDIIKSDNGISLQQIYLGRIVKCDMPYTEITIVPLDKSMEYIKQALFYSQIGSNMQ